MSENKLYKRKSDGKVAQPYKLVDLAMNVKKVYYVIPGEPKNISQDEVDNVEKWEKVYFPATKKNK